MKAWTVDYRGGNDYNDDRALVLAQTANQAIRKACVKLHISVVRVTEVRRVQCDEVVK